MTSTNHFGRTFISYQHSRQSDIDLLRDVLHEYGIPTWQDRQNLRRERAREEIKALLQTDADIASAILWITPEVKDSDFIQGNEIDPIMDRHANKDGFFVIPCLAGGLVVEQADQIMRHSLHGFRPSEWNLHEINQPTNRSKRGWPWQKPQEEGSVPLTRLEAEKVAEDVLEHRLQAIDRHLSEDEPFRLRIHQHVPSPDEKVAALDFDWSHDFTIEQPENVNWDNLWQAIRKVAGHYVYRYLNKRSVEVEGRLRHTAAFLLGAAFMEPLGIPIRIKKEAARGVEEQYWSLEGQEEDSGYAPVNLTNTVTALPDAKVKEAAVLVSVANDTLGGFEQTRDLPEQPFPVFCAVSHITGPNGKPKNLETPSQARHVSRLVREVLLDMKQPHRPTKFHLFLATPAPVAMMIGQLSNALGAPIQLYEYTSGIYRPSACITPGG